MTDSDIKNIYHKMAFNNYLSNCYRYLTKSKVIHILLLLVEILINIIEELDLILKDFNPGNEEQANNKLSFISSITVIFMKLSKIIKVIILSLFVIIFNFLYLLLKKYHFRKRRIYIVTIVNILELLYFRVFMTIFLNLLFTLTNVSLLILIILFLPHLYLVFNNFLYNHLYYCSPVFVNYPYDEFSSSFDIILLIIKLILAVSFSSKDKKLVKFFFIILFLFQIIVSIFFINKLINHSYLFMKNTFLNKIRLSLFLAKSIIISLALLVGKNEILTILFNIISISSLLIIISYIYFIYNPYYYIKIKIERPMENIYYYLYILSNKENLNFLYVKKMNEHYEKCGICNICQKYFKTFKKNENDDEEESLLKKGKNELINDKEVMDIFNIIYDGKNKFFNLMRNIIINNNNNKSLKSFNNNEYYYINLSFLLYSDYEKNNITLSLNEKLILEIISENCSFTGNDRIQINYLLITDEFICLSKKVLNQLKIIINAENNFNKAKDLIDLSFQLKDLKDNKYQKNLLNHKVEKHFNVNNIILVCSIIYEEIFNSTININQQLPIRDNIQHLEDTFLSNKLDKIISLSVDLNNNNCKIIRAGKDLLKYVNTNLFELFPLIFKQYQIDIFLSSILNNYDNIIIKKNLNIKNVKKKKSIKNKIGKNIEIKTLKNKNKKEYIDINLIFCQNISSKMYYRLLNLKITPLLTNDNYNFILFDGLYYIYEYTVITTIDYVEKKNIEIIFSVSKPDLENNMKLYYMSLKQYNKFQNNKGYTMSKIFSINIFLKIYNIYILIPKDEKKRKKFDKKRTLMKESKIIADDDEEETKTDLDNNKNLDKNAKDENNKLFEDNASVASQENLSIYNKGFSANGIKSKKKDNLDEYKDFNKIQKIIYLLIIIILIAFIIEYFHINNLQNNIVDFNDSFIKYRKFSKYYYQLLPLVLSLSCIKQDSLTCNNLLSYYTEQYYQKYPDIKYDITLLLKVQTERISNKILDKRTIIAKIYNLIGEKKYEEIFGKIVNYSHIIETLINGYTTYNVNLEKIKFYDAIFMMINSYTKINMHYDPNSIIYFLNKTNQSFTYLNSIKPKKQLTDSQKEIYELILNYKIYANQFDTINNTMKEILYSTSNSFQIFLCIYLNLNIILILFISFLIYLYFSSFENIMIKIINYINMIINNKTDEFNFRDLFKKKLDNLEIMLQLNNEETLKSIINLTNIYNDYQLYLSKKNKNEAKEMGKRGYRKNMDESKKKDEFENIPKNQRIVEKNKIRKFYNAYIYILMNLLIIFITIIFYIILLILWINYFNIKKNLYSYIEKNTNVESSIYNSINIYYLMIFSNLTINEITQNIYNQYYDLSEPFNILKVFYRDLKISLTSLKEKNILGDLYDVFEKKNNFSCEILYKKNDEFLEEIDETDTSKKIKSIKKKFIELCNNLKLSEANDSFVAFTKYFHNINNGIFSINNFTYEGLINHLKTGNLGDITFYFSNIIIFISEIIFHKPNKKTTNNVLALLAKNIKKTEILFVIIAIIIIIINLFYLISKIKKYCAQILLLKNTFKIFDSQEQ